MGQVQGYSGQYFCEFGWRRVGKERIGVYITITRENRGYITICEAGRGRIKSSTVQGWVNTKQTTTAVSVSLH